MTLLQQEQDLPSAPAAADCIDIAVGGEHHIHRHRLGLQLKRPDGSLSPRLVVERFYWDLPTPVAVDFASGVRYGEPEVLAKKLYFREHDAHYILVRDAFDGEGAEAALAHLEPEAEARTPKGNLPHTGPRRKR